MISSTHIVFAPVDRLEPGMIAEIAVAWPSLLEGRIRLELVLQVTVIHTRDGVAEARILAYDFRTRTAEAQQRAELAPGRSRYCPPK